MKLKNILLTVVVVVLLLVLVNGFYTVSETQQVVITQFGKPVGGPIIKSGLHWKAPFIQQAHFFEKRVLAWDGDPNQIPTKDKKYIWIDLTARWRIVDPLTFLQSVGNETGAQGRLDDIVDAVTRDFVSDNLLVELVRNTNRKFEFNDSELSLDSTSQGSKISLGRDVITRKIYEQAKVQVVKFGIDLVDVRIKRINYVQQVRKKVYERMISERRRIAERYRSEGKGEMAEIQGKKQKELQRITSEAYRKAKEIQGNADAEATRIYARAYNSDPEFYAFIKTLHTYKTSIDSVTTLILTTKSDYFKYIKRIK
ncbi:protease modulator HflC [candidate division KSB1 bacterium]|nr:MAG: protease modulator HflC [candidate division KSB1 bacterium]